ncbi:MAG: alpha/beta hydrolase, partial [Actinomycetes bacterium]
MNGLLYRQFRSVEELDAQYNLRAAVDDFDGYVAGYLARSEQTRQAPHCRIGLPYGRTLAETFDLFLGPGTGTVVFIHGGYWHSSDSRMWRFVADGLVRAGMSVVVENYALCPAVSMTEIVRQHRALIAHLHRNGAELGIDRDRIVVAGHSAG